MFIINFNLSTIYKLVPPKLLILLQVFDEQNYNKTGKYDYRLATPHLDYPHLVYHHFVYYFDKVPHFVYSAIDTVPHLVYFHLHLHLLTFGLLLI